MSNAIDSSHALQHVHKGRSGDDTISSLGLMPSLNDRLQGMETHFYLS